MCGDYLSCRRRCRCALVGHEIGDRKICFVADRGNNWDRRSAYRPRDRLFVKGPKIFDRATTPADDDYIDGSIKLAVAQCALMMLVEKTNCAHDLMRCSFALHARARDQNVDRASATRDDVENVPQRRPVRRGDDADTPGKHGNGTL